MLDKRLVYVAFWNNDLVDLIAFLKANNYQDTTTIEHIEYLLGESEKVNGIAANS